MLLTLENSVETVQTTMGPIQALLRPSEPNEETNNHKHWKKIRRKFQSMVYAKLHKAAAPNVHERFAHKLARWKLHQPSHPLHAQLSVIQSTPNWQARCAHQRLKAVARLTAPRVHAAVFGAVWNRWNTKKRYQLRGRCRLCQKPHTEDAIEHYVFCNTVREVASRRLRLDTRSHVNIHTFTCTNPLLHSKELLTRAALLIYATYKALNHQRHAPCPLQSEDLYHAMCQWIVEGVRGHAYSCKVLASTWTNREHTPLPKIQ